MPMRVPTGRGIVLFKVGPIEIAVHPSWLVTFGVVALIAHVEITPHVVARNGGLAPIVSMGIALLFYTFILLHELSHAVVARAYGIDAKRITLFIFGGVAQIGAEAQRPSDEYHIAIAGPLASLIIACVLAAISRGLHPGGNGLPGLWGYLAGVNLALTGFNLIPAFPLDGGRLLRAGLWGGLRDRVRATRWAANMGKAFAFLLMGGGGAILAVSAYDRDATGIVGIWYVVLGYFVFTIAGTAGRAEGGAEPRTGPTTVRPPEPPVTVSADEGEAAEPDASRRGTGPSFRPEPPRPPADQPGDGSRHP
jgi:Zn-dependent protease